MRRLAFSGLLLSMFFVLGCSDPYQGRLGLKGTVIVEQKPLEYGTIMFEPLDGQDTSSGADIANGSYEVPRSAGLKPGKYLVRITAGDGKTPAVENEEEAAGPGGNTNIVSFDIIPEEWNINSRE
jgi:hypothetical protein